jgi:hypothetical protein
MDDFYDDNGVARQPRVPIPSLGPDFDRVPRLDEVENNIDQLLDYLYTRESVHPTHEQALRRHRPDDVIETSTRRFHQTREPSHRWVLYLAVATAGGPRAADWFRSTLPRESPIDRLRRLDIVQTSLSHHEVLDIALAAIEEIAPDRRQEHLRSLFKLPDPRLVTWIESNACQPVANVWGELAAACDIDWVTTRRWLKSGRPLSLVALDSIACRSSHAGSCSTLPRLQIVGGRLELFAALEELAATDPVPRITKLVEQIAVNADAILG